MLNINFFFDNISAAEHGAIFVLFCFSLFCGSCVLICKNPIFSLIFLISTFASMSMVFLILHIEFLALTFLIVYIGAISILFLFVIMMFNLKRLYLTETSFELFYIIATTCLLVPKFFIVLFDFIEQFLFSAQLNLVVNQTIKTAADFDSKELLYIMKYKNNDVLLLSDFLYTTYGNVFLLIGVILLSSMLGSIVLAMLSQTKQK